MEFKFRNINDAFKGLVEGMYSGRVPTDVRPSRYGEVVAVTEPVLIHYSHPRERILFNAARDCNPFAMLYESLWMLAGRNDVAPLAYYTPRFKEFSDDGEILNDAYGYRWRRARFNIGPTNQLKEGDAKSDAGEIDQLQLLINHLRGKPESRRAVLQMWNVEDDLLKIDGSRAVCCNTQVFFKVYDSQLDMTVTSRSSDLIWGQLGADYVTFTLLQEYVAAHLGMSMGIYYHLANDLHAYVERWQPEKWLSEKNYQHRGGTTIVNWEYQQYEKFPFIRDPVVFDQELPTFVQRHSSGYRRRSLTEGITEPFLLEVAHPLLQAFHYWKDEPAEAMRWVERIKADDWRMVATSWLRRRLEKRKSNNLEVNKHDCE